MAPGKERDLDPVEEWTFGDGFQTSQILWNRALTWGGARGQCRGQSRFSPQKRRFAHSPGLLEAKRDGFQTPDPSTQLGLSSARFRGDQEWRSSDERGHSEDGKKEVACGDCDDER